ncbi:hypothetical protein BDZ97DRAFT_1657897 [Flammula alnicola]|nr:hypothetical protein BDZ97DRAFT_1657897 [Flammula alnicola]
MPVCFLPTFIAPSDQEITEQFSDHGPRKRARTNQLNTGLSEEWFPWEDKITCSLDILMHLPRSVFSRKQLDLFLWLLRINDVDDVPSTKSLKTLNKILQNSCGVDTLAYDGKLGHRYHVNNMAQILAQEMCNPKVRPHIHFYPEDTGKRLDESRQAERWLKELRPEETTPMVRVREDDYYIYEPALLKDLSMCIPERWFTRNGTFFARAWKMEIRVVDGVWGWVVRKDIELEVSEHQLAKGFASLEKEFERYRVPHPSLIHGYFPKEESVISSLLPWKHTNPVLGNRWRTLAKGHRVVSLPLWMYCDDTSGNMSKKWNEHNSFLFTLAGLPREHTAKEYNIHFLCTSNLAPPLEMMDGVVSQTEVAQRDGIWAWDSEHKEPILIFPAVLALLGDNPMHSEFACHIGLRGKFFCRSCWVKGSDAEDAGNIFPNIGNDSRQNNSSIPTQPSTSRKRKKYEEGYSAMLDRVSAFVKLGEPRNKAQTQRTLDSYFQKATIIGSKTELKKARTQTGIKDTVQEFHFKKLFSSYKGKHGPQAKQRALDAVIAELPSDITSPVWRLQGLDPHEDTPVEILHVVLLGFIKYFWRDMVRNQVNDDQKILLIQRLNSVDVRGLGISQLSGDTLVNYAGSLTGRDFRTIAQVAPFVIIDMVADDVFEAWLALSKLVPLLWQPIINDIDEYSRTVEHAIKNFLLKTAQWTCAWFNKSKFHIILHIPAHIRRFGPAILFATESFESFNAVIRAKSVHSNRQAPSRDIAMAFAQGNRVRHLLSGGYFIPAHLLSTPLNETLPRPEMLVPTNWRTVGPGPLHLIHADQTVQNYLGLLAVGERTLSLGICCTYCRPGQLYVTGREVCLLNGDKCVVGQHVIVQPPRPNMPTFIACLREIIQQVGSQNHDNSRPDGLLLETVDSSNTSTKFQMPRLQYLNEWSFVPISDLLCTVNTQHDCDTNKCTTSGFRYVYQERVRTQRRAPIVQHIKNPDDLILNTAQMRDAIHLQKFRIPPAVLDEPAVIDASVRRMIDKRKKSKEDTEKEASGQASMRGHSRGRGARARGRGRGIDNPTRARGHGRSALSMPGELVLDFSASNV